MNSRAHSTWITFDCFGTLVDWHNGFRRILQPLAGDRTDELIAAYHPFERELEQEKPHRLYREVLTEGLRRAADRIGWPLSLSQASALAEGWGSQRLFDDVEPALAELRGQGYRLGVLTNCDDDLFAQTQRAFRQPFDAVITAQQVQDYKPRLTHFECFLVRTGVERASWVHVACSWFHDITPARQMGIRSIWLDRELTGEDPNAASARITSARELQAALSRMSGRAAFQPPSI